MATPSAVGAACLVLARAAAGARGGGDRARPRRLQRVVRRRCVAELSREGPPAPRPLPPPALLAPPLVPGFLAPPSEPKGEPASTPPPVPDAGLGDLALEPEGIAEGSIDNTVVVASEQDSEIAVGKEQARAKVTQSIVFVTGEASPYAKSGGLGDVCGSLPVALAARGHRVMVVMPRYLNGISDKNYANAFYTEKHIRIPCFGGEHEVAFFHEYRDSVDWVFVDHPSYHRPGNLYGDKFGAYGDNQFRYTLLCYAACEAPLVLELGGYIYGQNCMFVVNDWHASLVPVLLAAKYRPYGVYKDSRSILVIHNLAHQGVEPASTYPDLGLPPEWYGALEWVFPEWARRHALDKGEAVNFLKGAVVTADRIVTVSKGYSWEVTTAEGGQGLNELLSSRKSVLNGIVNGIDINDWNPATDKCIPYHYSVEDLSGKAKCKSALQKELGLPIRPEVPLVGFIGRLDYQKGIDLIQLIIPHLMQDDVQFALEQEHPSTSPEASGITCAVIG